MPKANMELSGQDRAKILHWAKSGFSVSEICKRVPGLTPERCRGIANKAGFFFPTQRERGSAKTYPPVAIHAGGAGVDPVSEEEVSHDSLAHLEGVPGSVPAKERINVLEAPRPGSLFAANERIERLERTIRRLERTNKELEGVIIHQARQSYRGPKD